MCEQCRKRAARIPKKTITAIEAHRAELIEVLIDINNAANAEINERSADLSDEDRAIGFAPYVIGYLVGMMDYPSDAKVGAASLINPGLQAGCDILNSRITH